MEVSISNIKIELDDIEISQREIIELAKNNVTDENEFIRELFEKLVIDQDTILSCIDYSELNRFILDNINFLYVTDEMQQNINRLESKLRVFKEKIKILKSGKKFPEFKSKTEAKDWFCDLLNLSHYANEEQIISEFLNLIK